MSDFSSSLTPEFLFKPPLMLSSNASGTPRSGLNSNFDHDFLFRSADNQKIQHFGGFDGFGDVFGGPLKYTNAPDGRGGGTLVHCGSLLNGSSDSGAKSSSLPAFDKPIYDKDIFEGVPGLKSSSSVKYNDVFSTTAFPWKQSDVFDYLLGGLGKKETELKGSGRKGSAGVEKAVSGFDDFIPGFGRSTSPSERRTSKLIADAVKTTSSGMEHIDKHGISGSTKVNSSSVNGVVFNNIDSLAGVGKSVPMSSSETNKRGKDKVTLQTRPSLSRTETSNKEPDKSTVGTPETLSLNVPTDDQESRQTKFNMHSVSTDFVCQTVSPLSHVNATSKDTDCQERMSLKSEENLESSDVWLMVSDIRLVTQPTGAPPPSRPPPRRPTKVSKAESGSPTSTNARKNLNKSSSFPHSMQYFQIRKSVNSAERSSAVSQIDELEDFTMGRTVKNVEECADFLSGEGPEMNLAAAAMKKAMDRAQANFKHAKELRERENAKTTRSEETIQDAEVRELRERQERFDHKLQQRETEEEKRERKRLEKEGENTREIEREREDKEEERRCERETEKARQAVERASREARGRAVAEAQQKAERAAVEKANAEARERAERAMVQRVQAEAHERAAAEAKERAEKAAAAEAKERANAEAREKEARERAAFARADAEAKRKAELAAIERAAEEVRETAAAVVRASQQKNENDKGAFFCTGTQPSSAHGPRPNSLDPSFNTQHENGKWPEVERTSNGASSSKKKASSTANIVDDLTSAGGGKVGPLSGELQEVELENEERCRARLERHQRTQERVAKALAEKNQRDLQAQKEQEERHRIADALDAEIQRWAAGKEGNLRALLSTLQYILWPECGWQPVSLADLVIGASVKKVYRKATLCIHPDKVQQKGSNLQQKYIAEKVFDLLKEAWNKFNSELF